VLPVDVVVVGVEGTEEAKFEKLPELSRSGALVAEVVGGGMDGGGGRGSSLSTRTKVCAAPHATSTTSLGNDEIRDGIVLSSVSP
jgi:hypothetical protein